MTALERATLARLTLAFESIHAQLDALTDGDRPVPVQNVRGLSYLLGMTVERLGIVAGTVVTDDGQER